MGEIDKKHINEFIKGQMTEYIYIALSDLVFFFNLKFDDVIAAILRYSMRHFYEVDFNLISSKKECKMQSYRPVFAYQQNRSIAFGDITDHIYQKI